MNVHMEVQAQKVKWSIRTRLILLVLLATLPALGIILYNGLIRRQDAIADARLNLMRLTETLANLQVTLTTSTRQMLMTLAQLPELRTRQAPRFNKLFAELLKHNPFYNTMVAATSEGEVFTAGVPFAQINITDRKYFQDVMATGDFAVGEFAISRTTRIPTIHFAYPVLGEAGQITAVVLIGFNLSHYQQFLGQIHLPQDSVAGIADHNCYYLYRFPTFTEGGMDVVGQTTSNELLEHLCGPKNQGSFTTKGLDGIERFYSFKQLRLREGSPPYLYLWVGIPAKQVVDKANLELGRNLLLLGLATLLALLGAWHLGNLTIVNRLQKLVQASQSLGGGALETRTHLPYSSGGELGLLAQAFDDMAAQLERQEHERRQAEEALKTLVDKSPFGIFIIQDGKFALVNPGFQEITGYRSEELLGQEAMMLVVPEFQVQVREQAVEMLKGKRHAPYEYQFLTKQGEIRWAMERVASTEIDGKRAAIGYFVDVTEHNRLEEQLAQLQRVEAIGVLAGGIAHDFNNLLTAIMAHTEMMLMDQGQDHPHSQHLRDIMKASQRGNALTQQLLAFSRRQILQPRVFNLNEVVAEIEKMLRRLIGEDIDLATVLEPQLGAVKADPGQVEQIIMNLAVNARDAMPRGGRLTLETANVLLGQEYVWTHPAVTPGPYIMLAVSDTGVGMEAHLQKRIFEPFFTTKELGRGTGLGLATVYGIVKQSGGYIWVYSEVGQGTTFKVYLPRVAEAALPLKAPDVAPPPTLYGRETVLVVEDDGTLRTIISRGLGMFGYTVLLAGHGDEALEVAARHDGPIHLLLTDVIMPRMSGLDLAARLAPLYPDMKILYMSGYTDNAIVHHGVLDDALTFLQKPFQVTTLLQKVREVLGATPDV